MIPPRLLVPALLLAALSAPAAPRLECSESVHDFGRLLNDREVEHTFLLRNTGTDPVEVLAVTPSCSCTGAEIGTRYIPAGTETTVRVRGNLRGRVGQQELNVTVFSNDPANRALHLQLTGEALTHLLVDPPLLSFGTLPTRGSETRSVTISSPVGDRFEVLSVVSEKGVFKPAVVPLVPGERFRVDVSVSCDGRPGGALTDNLVVKTSHPRADTLNLAVFGNIPEPINHSPHVLTLLPSPSRRPVNRYVTLRPGLVSGFKVLKAEFPDPGATVTVKFHGPATGYQVTIAGISVRSELHGRVMVIETDVPGKQRIEIPIQILDDNPPPTTPVPSP